MGDVDWGLRLAATFGRPLQRVSHAGGMVNVPLPEVDQIHIMDISQALANIPRFGGWNSKVFVVGQHSLEVSKLCRDHAYRFDVDPIEAAMAGLMHDAPEAYIGDMITPIKRLLGSAWSELDDEVTRRVNLAFGISGVMNRCREVVAWADAEMVVSDMVRWATPGTLVTGNGAIAVIGEDRKVPPPFVLRFGGVKCMTHAEANRTFVKEFLRLESLLRPRLLQEKRDTGVI